MGRLSGLSDPTASSPNLGRINLSNNPSDMSQENIKDDNDSVDLDQDELH